MDTLEQGATARSLDDVIAHTPRQAVAAAAERALQGRAELLHARWAHMAPQAVLRQMLRALRLMPHHRVLEIGAGAGWTTLLLAQLAREVHTIERLPALAQHVEATLAQHNLTRAYVHVGEAGWPGGAPYDAILVSAPVPKISPAWLRQLKPGGCLVIPVGQRRDALQLLRLSVSPSGAVEREELGVACFASGLADVLAESGQAPQELLRQAGEQAALDGRPLEQLLLEQGLVPEHEVYRALALLHGLELWSVEQAIDKLDRAIFRVFSRSFVTRNKLVPLYVDHASSPTALHIIGTQIAPELESMCTAVGAQRCAYHLITPTDLVRVMSVLELEGRAPSGARGRVAVSAADLLTQAATEDLDAQLVAIFDALLLDAIGSRASDIHFERYEEQVKQTLGIDIPGLLTGMAATKG